MILLQQYPRWAAVRNLSKSLRSSILMGVSGGNVFYCSRPSCPVVGFELIRSVIKRFKGGMPMKTSTVKVVVVAAAGLVAGWSVMAANPPAMGFFVTSKGLGNGANLGGLAGADAHCQALAKTAGAGNRTWAAYLSTQGANAVNARDRIGTGPWYNAKGVQIAANVAALHQATVNLTVETVLDEKGQPLPAVALGADGAPLPREKQSGVDHDILTGTQADGAAFPAGEDRTCKNWTSGTDGAAMLGHGDRRSLTPGLSPWGAAHPSQGCTQENLVATGGAGRFYCFAK
jgi:hypothetical protein